MTNLSEYIGQPVDGTSDPVAARTGPAPDEPRSSPANLQGDQLERLLRQLHRNALELLDGVARTPSALRIQLGQVRVEVEWQEQATVATAASGPAVSSGSAIEPRVPACGPTGTAGQSATGHPLRAPSVGVFYLAPEPGAAPFVAVGDTVRAGQQVGIVEVMKLMIPIEADRPGRVLDILKQNADPVEYDEPVILLAEDS